MLSKVFVQKYPGGSLCRESREVYAHCLMENIQVTRCVEADIRARSVLVDTSTLPVGSVEFVRAAMDAMQIRVPRPNYYPAPLSEFLHRRVWQTTAGEVAASVAREHPLFAKSHDWKVFTGQVVDAQQGMGELIALPAETLMWACEPTDWLTESRAYVVDGRVLGVAGYAGDESLEPDRTTITQAAAVLASEPDCPRGYAFDWGVLRDGRTALVEMNDGWAIGLYSGMGRRPYFEMLEARWEQLASAPSMRPEMAP